MENKFTLKSFVENNQAVLTSIEVLAAMATLLGTLSINWIAYLLSFLMFSALAILWSEIQLQGNEQDEWSLYLFKLLLKISYWLIILYILLSHRILSWFTLFVPILFFLLLIVVKLLKKSKRMVKYIQSNKPNRKTLAFGMIFVIMLVSFVLSIILSIPANQALDQIDHLKSEIQNLY